MIKNKSSPLWNKKESVAKVWKSNQFPLVSEKSRNDPKHTTSSIKHSGGSIMAQWLTGIYDFTADRIGLMNSEEHR